jgi:hypothetical protein
MKNKKKIIFFFILVLLGLFVVSKPFLEFSVGKFVHFYCHKYLDRQLEYKKVHIGGRLIYLEDVCISEENGVKISAKRADISWSFYLFKLFVDVDVKIQDPKLTLIEGTELFKDIGFISKSQGKFFRYNIDIKQGEIELINKKGKETLQFSLDQKNLSNYFQISCFSNDKDKSPIMTVHLNKDTKVVNIQLSDMKAHTLYSLSRFFYDFHQIEKVDGFIDGNITYEIKKSKAYVDLNCKDLKVSLDAEDLMWESKRLNLQISNYHSLNVYDSLLSKLSHPILNKNFRIKTFVEQGKLFSKKDDSFAFCDINCSYSFNPGVGPKIDLSAVYVKDDHKLPINIDGRGYFHSTAANWLDVNCNFEDFGSMVINVKERDNQNCDLFFHLNKVALSTFDVLKPFTNRFFEKGKLFHFEKGVLDSNIHVVIDYQKKCSCFLKEFSVLDSKIVFDDNIELSFDGFEGTCQFDLNNNFYRSFSSHLSFNSANLSFNNNINITDLQAKLSFEKGFVKDCKAFCKLNNINTDIKLLGTIDNLAASSFLEADFCDFAKLFVEPTLIPDNKEKTVAVINLKQEENFDFAVYGNVQINRKNKILEDLVFSFKCDNLFTKEAVKISNGWIRGEDLLLDAWNTVLLNDSKMSLEGIADISASFSNELVDLKLKGRSLKLLSEYANIELGDIGDQNLFTFEKDKSIQCIFDLQSKKTKVDICPFSGTCSLPNFSLFFDLESNGISIDNDILDLSVLKAISENVDFSGKIFVNIADENSAALSIYCDHFSSSVFNLTNFFKHFQINKIPKNIEGLVEGQFSYYKKFLEDSSDWDLKADLKDVNFNIFPGSGLKGAFAKINWNSFGRLEISDVKGEYFLKQEKYDFICPVFEKKQDEIFFDIRLQGEICDVLRTKGKILLKEDFFEVALDNNLSHFFDNNIHDFSLRLGYLGNVKLFDLDISSSHLSIMKQLSFLTKSLNNNFFDSFENSFFEGDIRCIASFKEDSKLNFKVNSDNLSFSDKKYHKLAFEATRVDNLITVDNFDLDEFKGKFSVNLTDANWLVNGFSLKRKDMLFLTLEGNYDREKDRFDADVKNIKFDFNKLKDAFSLSSFFEKLSGQARGDGHFSLEFPNLEKTWRFDSDWYLYFDNLKYLKTEFDNKDFINFHYSTLDGLKINGVDLSFFNPNIDLGSVGFKAGNISYEEVSKRWLFKDSILKCPLDLLTNFVDIPDQLLLDKVVNFDKDWLFNFDLEFLSDLSFVKLCSKQTNIPKNNLFKDICIQYDKKSLTFDCKYLHEDNFYRVYNKLVLSYHQLVGKTVFYEVEKQSETPLTCDWIWKKEDGLKISSIQGDFCGLNVGFFAEGDDNNIKMIGGVKIDFTRAISLFPKQVYSLLNEYAIGAGYELRGALVYNKSGLGFSGTLFGKQFEVASFQLKTLLANISISKNIVSIEDLKISDTSGFLQVDKITIENILDDWKLTVPSLNVREFRPSLLKHKDEKNQSEIKPLVIRNFTLKNFEGTVGDKKSFTGKGSLKFINSFKRDHTVLDIPSDMLSRIVGLDLELLTPVSGHIDYIVSKGKFCLLQLLDSFSEGKRSKFFFVEREPLSYIDFDGSIDVEVKMKQFVLFKFTENLIISIKGDVHQPKMKLNKKRSVF